MAEFDIEKVVKDAVESTLDNMIYDGKSIREWMRIIASGDFVSREVAIKAICKHCTPKKPERCPTAEICHSYQELKNLPHVTSKKRSGKWIPFEEDYYYCTACKYLTRVEKCLGEIIFDYCPKCGAKMGGEQNDSN